MFERCLYFNANALTREINKIWDTAFQEFDLSPSHAYLLRVVLANPGISQKDIATEMKLEKSTITRFVDVLQDKGYLTRNKVGRAQIIKPTKAAIKIEKALNKKGDELYQKMIDTIGRQSLTQLVSKLRETGTKLH